MDKIYFCFVPSVTSDTWVCPGIHFLYGFQIHKHHFGRPFYRFGWVHRQNHVKYRNIRYRYACRSTISSTSTLLPFDAPLVSILVLLYSIWLQKLSITFCYVFLIKVYFFCSLWQPFCFTWFTFLWQAYRERLCGHRL